MSVWDFASSSAWSSLMLVVMIWVVTYTIEACWDRFWRHRNIRKLGYPPSYCDADGDPIDSEGCGGCDGLEEDNNVITIMKLMDRKIEIYEKVLKAYANIESWKYRGVGELHTSFEMLPQDEGWMLAEEALKKAKQNTSDQKTN
ncbi:MAG: hypothetical protein M0R17_01725 [Candidatus Omnitrophica bacterium]|jgi:hypothetical protein|nr:hypothetical protein [Candidatus Omnitrophota bacterium]